MVIFQALLAGLGLGTAGAIATRESPLGKFDEWILKPVGHSIGWVVSGNPLFFEQKGMEARHGLIELPKKAMDELFVSPITSAIQEPFKKLTSPFSDISDKLDFSALQSKLDFSNLQNQLNLQGLTSNLQGILPSFDTPTTLLGGEGLKGIEFSLPSGLTKAPATQEAGVPVTQLIVFAMGLGAILIGAKVVS